MISKLVISMFLTERIRRPTYEELEHIMLNSKLKTHTNATKISMMDMIKDTNIDFNDFDIHTYDPIKELHKETQKDYELQNHDLFPEMYIEIDATGSNIGTHESRAQTKRYIPKDFDIFSSIRSPGDKPSSNKSSSNVVSKSSSEELSERRSLFSRERESFRRLFLDDTEKRYYNIRSQSISSSSSNQQITQEQNE